SANVKCSRQTHLAARPVPAHAVEMPSTEEDRVTPGTDQVAGSAFGRASASRTSAYPPSIAPQPARRAVAETDRKPRIRCRRATHETPHASSAYEQASSRQDDARRRPLADRSRRLRPFVIGPPALPASPA